MFKALARKELREALPLVVPALALELLLVCVAVGLKLGVLSDLVNSIVDITETIPFINDSICTLMIVVGGFFAVALGLWQTVWESGRGTFQFLLHRPVPREQIFGVKLLVGGTLSLLVVLIPVAIYALWAATPGTHASPFFWPMTFWAWLMCLMILLLYLGAFLSGLRQAAWFASRFFPLLASLICLGIFGAISDSPGGPWAAGIILLGVMLLTVGFVYATNYVARTQDFS